MTKNRTAHRLHLHPAALELLRVRHVAAGLPAKGIVFPAPRSGKAINAFSRIRRALGEAAPDVVGWRFHDCRRSFATALGEARFPEAVVDAVLNHRRAATRGGVIGTYQRSERWPEQVLAMQTWGRLLNDALNDKSDGGVVVPLVIPVAK